MQQTQLKKSSSTLENNRNRIQQLWLMQSEIIQKLQKQKINEKCIILVGDTNVGKTTLLYYLSGMKLNLVQNTAKRTKQMEPQIIYLDAKVSNSQSTTQVPNIFSQISQLSQISLIDMPGLNDKKFINVLSNMFTFGQVFEKLTKISKIHIVFVISQEIFDVQQIKQNLQQFVTRFNVQSLKQAKNISIIFTKTQDDEQNVKEQFIEFIQQIRQQLQDDEDQKNVIQLIDLIKQINQNQQLIFIFPKEDPNEDSGLKITKLILERDAFVDIGHLILNQLFVQNVLQCQKMKISTFQDNFIEVIQQSYLMISQCLDLSIGFTRFFHNKFATQIFKSKTDFETQLQSFYTNFETYFLDFNQNFQGQISLNKFMESIGFICENLTENRDIFLLDNGLKQLFTKFLSNQQNNQVDEIQLSLVSHSSKLLKNCIDRIANILSNFKQSEVFISSIKGISKFLNWISQKWYKQLGKAKTLQKVKKLLMQSQQELQKKIIQKWTKIVQQKTFIDVINRFSQKAQQSQSDNESQQGQAIQVEQKVQDNGYYGNPLKQLKRRYFKVDHQPKLDESKAQAERILEQERNIDQKIKKVVQILENQIVSQVIKTQKSGKFKISLNPQRIAFILFQMRKLRHRIFLQSVMKNFSYYLKFIYYSLVLESEKEKLMEILKGYVDNLCIILDQYSLFEEEILLMLFVHRYNRICKVFERGIRTGRIGQDFIKNQLINHIKVLISSTQCIQDLQQFVDITITAYNYIIVEYSSTRSQSIQYEKQMNQMLNQLYKKINSFSHQYSIGSSTHETELKNKPLLLKQPNYFVIANNPHFEFQTIAYKIDILEKRNTQLQTYQIFHHFHQSIFKYPQGKTTDFKSQVNTQSVKSN